jgi:Asp-tRNA(Asn)/Glu-tRNA(Gln) amidotransferase A subunit family amidase
MESADEFSGHDMTAARSVVEAGEVSAHALVLRSLERAHSTACARAFLRVDATAACEAAQVADHRHAAGMTMTPLAGLAISIKDLFDIAGQVTTAGSTLLADRPPAATDAVAVARLRQAGAALIGRTNMTEFAFSAVGTNPHYGTPANAGTWPDVVPRIPGGSTSGGAVSVAVGAAWAALGSDTGGSIRIPAALQGLVGFKPTARLVPGRGSIPLAPTLDSVGALTRSVRDAQLVHGVLAARASSVRRRPLKDCRLAVASAVMLEGLDSTVSNAFERAVSIIREQGASVEHVRLDELTELSTINAAGGLPAAESWAWHRALISENESRYDPRTLFRIRRGQLISAADYIDLLRSRADWQTRVTAVIADFDALLSPTVPMVAPPLSLVAEDDEAFFGINAQLLRNPTVVNFLDGCALSVPCHLGGELPVGLMVWHGAMTDDAILEISFEIEAALARVAESH